jgi:uncharacterized RDD family membrane protein YckC
VIAGSSLAGGAVLEGEALESHPDFARLTAARQAPQAALCARLNAIVLDLVAIGAVSQAIAAIAGSSLSGRTLIFLAIEFVYFFACELASGRTLGKRVFHVRVVTASGAHATAGQIALRNILRVVDVLPLLYASGLISMIRTGPARRQRIGDVAARTTVVLDEHGKALRTPRWLLPVLTLLATFLSLAVVIPAFAREHEGSGPAPVEGVWRANATPIGASAPDTRPTSATWTIETQCPAGGGCGLVLIFQAPRQAPVRARLARVAHGWLALFPEIEFPCGEQPGGRTLYARLRAAIGLHFAAHGLVGEGEERDLAESPGCGSWAARRRWTASYVGVG